MAAGDRLAGAVETPASETQAVQVGDQLVGGPGIDVKEMEHLDAEQMMEGQRLKFALRAIADQGHGLAAGAGQRARRDSRHGGCANRRGDRQFADQFRRAGCHVGENPEGHHGRQVVAIVGWVTVYVFEGIAPGVGHGHQFDDPDLRMIGHAGALVEVGPAQEVLCDVRRDTGEAFGDALPVDDLGDALGAQVPGIDTPGGVFVQPGVVRHACLLCLNVATEKY